MVSFAPVAAATGITLVIKQLGTVPLFSSHPPLPILKIEIETILPTPTRINQLFIRNLKSRTRIAVLDMQALGEFKLPHFFNYPPYFPLQPVRDTREKQIQLWKELIINYCRTQRIFVVGVDEDFLLFSNPVIERSLSHEARDAFLSALVLEGKAEWLDKSHKRCLILWHRIQDWADLIIGFVKDNGLEDSVMTVDEIRSGVESRGTELHGVDRIILMRALKQLENKGKLAIFKGTSADDDGVKFSI